MLPRVGDALPDARREREEGGEADRAATAEVSVERRREPAGDEAAGKLRGEVSTRMLVKTGWDVHMAPS